MIHNFVKLEIKSVWIINLKPPTDCHSTIDYIKKFIILFTCAAYKLNVYPFGFLHDPTNSRTTKTTSTTHYQIQINQIMKVS